MRLSAVAIAAALVAVAHAQSDYFPFAPEGPCIATCNDQAGKSISADFNSVDEYGPTFIKSLSYYFESGSENTVKFMSESGACMFSCSQSEQTAFRAQFAAKKAWYLANKNGTPPPRPQPTTTTTTTTVAPTPTTPAVDPAFPFLPNGPCLTDCINTAGKSLYSDYSQDPKSPYFWRSMAITYDISTADNMAFLKASGPCMKGCPKAENDLFGKQYGPQVAWYKANKPTTTVPPVTTTTTTTTTTVAPTPTTPAVDPAFPFLPDGPCVANCINTSGKSFFPNFSEDPKSPYFWQSLAYTFDYDHPQRFDFMTVCGTCQNSCPKEENDFYGKQYGAKAAWYKANKPTTVPPVTTTTTTTTTVAPTPTTPAVDPAFPFLPDGPCVANCINTSGKSFFPNFSEDPKSPYFWQSLAYTFDYDHPQRFDFMTVCGTCQNSCPKEENDFYGKQYGAKAAWYKANKPTTTVPPVTTTTTTTVAPTPTTPTTPVDPAFPFKPNGACVQGCINKVGKAILPNYSDDPKSPYFIQSLGLHFESGSPNTVQFHTEAGGCMLSCPKPEQDFYREQFSAMRTWYFANKNGGVNPPTTTKPTTTGPVPTGPVNPPSGGFPFKPNSACVQGCINKAGKAILPNYSDDPKSPYFIQSLGLHFESGSPNTVQFHTEAGGCMLSCPKAEQDFYREQFPAIRTWYFANKNGGVNPPTTTKPTTAGPVPTGPVSPPSGGFDFPFKPNSACIQGCINKAGKSILPNYSDDPKSPYFIQSLGLHFESGSPNTVQFHTEAGTCMFSCPKAEQDFYREQFPAIRTWYFANKNGGGNPTTPPVDPTNPTDPTTPPTGPITPPSGGFDFPFKPNGACVQGCINKVGKAILPNYSDDPKSPYFIQSLGLHFESGTPNTVNFHTDAGICMFTCPTSEQDFYRAQFPDMKAWYLANKNGGGNPTTPVDPNNPTGPTDPTAPPTGAITPPAGGYDYPFKPDGPCVAGCTDKVGKAMFPNYSEDPKSPYFLASLAFHFESGTPNTVNFHTDAGTCMFGCPKPEQDLYREQFPAKKAWYLANKNTNGTATPSVSVGVSPTGGPAATDAPASGAAKMVGSGLATVLAVLSVALAF